MSDLLNNQFLPINKVVKESCNRGIDSRVVLCDGGEQAEQGNVASWTLDH